ncbi:MAG TPA: reverse transcriptase domain-containing protein, partial [Candidatus Dojkabacteria bacterium]|nr:reverse transcriptase domain-containing protein [Candidatus Dojkabacteria bacterium]
TLTPNLGVAQGSIISPALFNIYSEDLLRKLESEEHFDKKDLLAYADDVLIICDSLESVRNAIEIIKDWSLKNNMKLNKKKSGIVEFVNRRSRLKLKDGTFQGFPICHEYCYLGLKLTSKLSMKSQLSFIWWKAKEMHKRLFPILLNSELDTRKNMRQIFIQPLIEFILPLYRWEPAISNLKRADSIIRGTFKLFAGLSTKTPNVFVDYLSGYDFKLRAQLVYSISQEKWRFRKNGRQFKFDSLPQI